MSGNTQNADCNDKLARYLDLVDENSGGPMKCAKNESSYSCSMFDMPDVFAEFDINEIVVDLASHDGVTISCRNPGCIRYITTISTSQNEPDNETVSRMSRMPLSFVGLILERDIDYFNNCTYFYLE